MVQGFDRVTILTPKQRYSSCSCSCSSVTFFTPPITRERLAKKMCVCVGQKWQKLAKMVKLAKTAEIGQKWTKLAKTAEIGKKKRTKLAKNGRNWPKQPKGAKDEVMRPEGPPVQSGTGVVHCCTLFLCYLGAETSQIQPTWPGGPQDF